MNLPGVGGKREDLEAALAPCSTASGSRKNRVAVYPRQELTKACKGDGCDVYLPPPLLEMMVMVMVKMMRINL